MLQGIRYGVGNVIFRRKLHLSCYCQNDINLSTIGEHIKGVTQNHHSDFVFFRFDVGAKAGIMINDKLKKGHSYRKIMNIFDKYSPKDIA